MPNMKTLELNAFEAKGLLNALKQIESENVNGLDEIINQLKQQQQQIATFDSSSSTASSSLSSGSTDQWTTVRITDTYSNLLTILTQSLDEIKRTNIQSVAIQTISILLDRLYRLDYTLVETQLNNTIGVPFSNFDKRYMCSETTRRATYNQWPHMDYKWVLPDALAQAGFFHQPTHPGDDRTICFACDLCLVAWEQQDQPWYIYLLEIFLKKRFKKEKIRFNLN
jgi:baculoviral IAP repeat-containing protein 6 (apollon)